MDMVQLLLEKGADANAIGSSGEIPLEWAIEFGGDEGIIQMLLTRLEKLSEGFPQETEYRHTSRFKSVEYWYNEIDEDGEGGEDGEDDEDGEGGRGEVCPHFWDFGTCYDCNDARGIW